MVFLIFCSFSNLNILPHFPITCSALTRSMPLFIFVPIDVLCVFPLASFYIFSVLSNVVRICLAIVLCFLLPGVHWDYWFSKVIVFIKFGIFHPLLFQIVFSLSFPPVLQGLHLHEFWHVWNCSIVHCCYVHL